MHVNRTGPYNAEIYLEKDPLPEGYIEPKNIGKYGYVDIPAEARMDQTVQQLNEKLSTYKPTKEQQLASQGIAHPTHWYDYLTTAPIVIPAVATAVTTAPEWGPAAVATVSNPAFLGELLKDTGTYIAADAISQGLTGKGMGSHINNAIGLEEDHPVGEFIGFGGTSALRRPIQKFGRKTYETIRGTLQPNYALSKAMDQALESSYISKEVGENGKIRLRLPSHTDKMPREIVLEPQGNNKFYVHVRTWNDIEGKVPANLTPREIGYLYEALYNELPEGAEILFPKSGPGNYATRGTVAGLQRLARDPRFAPGEKGELRYIDKDGNIKKFKGTSFFKRIDENPEYIERQLIPLAKQQGNWNGKTNNLNNIKVQYVDAAPWSGMFNGSTIFINSTSGDLDKTFIHEMRHAYDYSPRWQTVSSSGWFRKFLSSSPFSYRKQKAPIQLRKSQLNLLDRAYPTKFKNIFRGTEYRMSEKVATNAEFRKHLDDLYFQKFNKKPSVKELNRFIWSLSDRELAEELAKYGYRNSDYMHTYVWNMINDELKIPGNNFKTKLAPKFNLLVNKRILNKQKLSNIRYALTSVPSLILPVMSLNQNNEN